MIYRVAKITNVWIEADSEDDAIEEAQMINDAELNYLYFAEIEEHDHHWLCSDSPGVFICKCGSEGSWNRQEQKIEVYIHSTLL